MVSLNHPDHSTFGRLSEKELSQNSSKVFVHLFQKVVGCRGNALTRTPQSPEPPRSPESSSFWGLSQNSLKVLIDLFQNGRRGCAAPLFLGQRLNADLVSSQMKPGRGRNPQDFQRVPFLASLE